MRILFLTPQCPYPPRQGTSIRNYNLIANLASGHEVHLLSFEASLGRREGGPLHQLCRSVELVPAPAHSLPKRLRALFLSPLPDMALRLASSVFRSRLDALLAARSFDVVQVEGIEMARYGLRAKALAPHSLLVFDDHNAEYVLQRRAFETDRRDPRRWVGALYSLIQWRKLRRYEAMVLRKADRVIAVSQADREALRRLAPEVPIAVIPNGVDLDYYRPQAVRPLPLGPHSLVFTGKMDFRPNVDAVLWFWREVLPLIRAQIPDVHFYVVGQRPHPRLRPLLYDPAVTITGYVDDVRPYIAGATLCVVPLRIGGGTRLKVLEAMAMGKAIISTSLGCEGFELTPERELAVADEPEDFARRTVELLRDEATRREMGQRARRFVEERYDWRLIVPLLEQVYER